ncbi:MAG: protoheme IX farnesyltransferase [Dehalococcoidia bacterium]|nr:protoheme IX farnesyltransferase [Dehalococcoidia bacterium]
MRKQPSSVPVSPVDGAPRSVHSASPLKTVLAYLALTKPNIIVLLLVTTLAGMLAAGRGSVSWQVALITLLAGYLCAGGASTLNSWLDRDIDQLMDRTRKRPLPASRVRDTSALIYGIALGAISIWLFAVYVNVLSAALSAIAFVYYVFFYSWYLKRRTPQNIVVGGAAGAFPPLIGWTAVTGTLEPAAVFLFLIIFFWTPPHAWALALLTKEDYARAQVPMLPVVSGDKETTSQMLIYTWYMLGVTLLPAALGLFGWLYLGSALVLGLPFLQMAYAVHHDPSEKRVRRLYKYSTLYLSLIFLGLVLDRVWFVG